MSVLILCKYIDLHSLIILGSMHNNFLSLCVQVSSHAEINHVLCYNWLAAPPVPLHSRQRSTSQVPDCVLL